MDQFFPFGDPAGFTAVLCPTQNRPSAPHLANSVDHARGPSRGRVRVCIMNGAGGLVSMIDLPEHANPEQALAAAGWYRTQAWQTDPAGRASAPLRPIDPPAHPSDLAHLPPGAPNSRPRHAGASGGTR